MQENIRQSSPGFSYRVALLIFLTAYGYAVARYILAGPIEWSDAPLFVLNKGFALAAIFLFSGSFSHASLQKIFPASSFLRKIDPLLLSSVGVTFIVLHAIIAFILFNPEYYKEFFSSGSRLSLAGSFSLLGGVLSFTALLYYNINKLLMTAYRQAERPFVLSRNFVRISMLLLAMHLVFMGYAGWLKPAGWYAHLPPVSLLSFVLLCTGAALDMMRK